MSDDIDAATKELLICVAEEAGEITQMVGKILRFGFDSYHPNDPDKVDSRTRLNQELSDMLVLIDLLVYENIIDAGDITKLKEAKRAKLAKFLQHYEITDESSEEMFWRRVPVYTSCTAKPHIV